MRFWKTWVWDEFEMEYSYCHNNLMQLVQGDKKIPNLSKTISNQKCII